MLDIVARRHDATYGALVEIQHPLNHPALLRIKNLAVVMVCQHRGGFRIQFGILFLPLISRITASVVRWRSVWLAERKRRRLK